MMAVFRELLPRTASEKRGALAWDAATRTLTVTGSRARSCAAYLVDELPEVEGGRGFQLVKVEGGSDGEATGYAVFVARPGSGEAPSCECKGFLRWNKPCKHLAAILELLRNRQL